MTQRVILLLLLVTTLALISWRNLSISEDDVKISGINLVAPPKPIGQAEFIPLASTNANWLSVIPYGFLRPQESIVTYNYDNQWWGEGVVGASKTIQIAHELGYKVMLKPHVWVIGQGWAGDFEPTSEAHWKTWQDSYQEYILTFAEIAEAKDVALFCIGTEFRKTVVKRPEYWRRLIRQVKSIYKGKITYAANWDNYENVNFWDDLDFIGIDAYFPVCTDQTPSKVSVLAGWQGINRNIKSVSQKFDKPVLFTEYGYRSVDYAADGHWKYDRDTLNINYDAQINAYAGMFEAVWRQPWFKGGFLWKWHLQTPRRKERLLKEFTPQNKPAMDVIRNYYK
ncbi:MAG: hypothetical protein AAGA02_09530 [Bacteroidota bacterium]